MNLLLPHRHHLLAFLLIAGAALLCYAHSLNAPFYFDDKYNISENPHIQITDLSIKSLMDAAFEGPSANRPVAKISFALNYFWGQQAVFGYRLVNLGIHIVNGFLVYCLAQIIFMLAVNDPAVPVERHDIGRSNMAVFAALVFIAHPVQIQSVTYVVQRMTSLATLFYLTSFLFYLNGRIAAKQSQKWLYWTLSIGSWTLGLGTKEMTFTLPFLLVLAEGCFFTDRRQPPTMPIYLFVFVLMALACGMVLIYLGTDPFNRIMASYTYRDFTLSERVYTQFRVVVFYLSLLVFPIPSRLNLLHHIPISRSLVDPITTIFSMLIIMGLVGIAFLRIRKNPLISFGILWFFLHLLIESSVIGLEMAFEHRLYLPMVGFALLLSNCLRSVFKDRRTGFVLVCGVILVGFITASYQRNTTWRDPVVFWEDVLSKNPHSDRAHVALGIVLEEQGRVDDALDHYLAALRENPNQFKAQINMGKAYVAKGQLDLAVGYLKKAVQLKPEHAEAHINLGNAMALNGDLATARDHLTKAVQFKPHSAAAHYNLGEVLVRRGEMTNAEIHLRSATELQPDWVQAINSLGAVLARLGKLKEAAVLMERALQLEPENNQVHHNLGVVFERQEKYDRALHHFYKALQDNENDALVYNSIGVVLAKQGKIPEATENFQRALRLNPNLRQAKRNYAIARQHMESTQPSTSRLPAMK